MKMISSNLTYNRILFFSGTSWQMGEASIVIYIKIDETTKLAR
jgi:hypothetical protein